jgi:hypothetical protein
MTFISSNAAVIVLLAVGMAAAQNVPARTGAAAAEKPKSAAARSNAAAAPQAKPPEPEPIPQMSLEDLPAVAPKVSYRNGVLTVEAENARLGDVLDEIGRAIGAQIDKPTAADNERVAVRLTGTPRQVLAALLDDGKFGYALLFPMGDPGGIEKIILRGQSPAGSPFSGATPAQMANRRAMLMSSPGRPAPAEGEAPPTPSASVRVSASDLAPTASPAAAAVLQDNMAHAERQLADAAAQLGTNTASSASTSASSVSATSVTTPSTTDNQTAAQGSRSSMQVLQDLFQARRQLQEQQNQALKSQASQ